MGKRPKRKTGLALQRLCRLIFAFFSTVSGDADPSQKHDHEAAVVSGRAIVKAPLLSAALKPR
jgi:hypothetical protein